MISNGFHARELAVLRRLTTPERIQRFLDDEVGYNKEKRGPTCRSPRRVLADRSLSRLLKDDWPRTIDELG